jgi:acyl-CoA thioester hydrolase
VPPFRYYFRVRYGECDAQKVVFNARYGDYVDISTVEFLRACGLQDLLITGTLDYQLVKQTFEWKAWARFDQVLEASVRAARLGTTSFTLATEFRIAGDEAVVAAVETVYVLMDARTLAKVPISPELRRTLEAGAAGAMTNHAGLSEVS